MMEYLVMMDYLVGMDYLVIINYISIQSTQFDINANKAPHFHIFISYIHKLCKQTNEHLRSNEYISHKAKEEGGDQE